MMDKKILVTQASLPDKERYIKEISDIWDSHWLTNMGKKHEKFRCELVKYLNVPNIELFTNGHMALELSLQSLGVKGEVITTPFTFASTTHAIVRSGLKPVFCDIDSNTYCIDPEKIERMITPNTVAIVPVHVYGNICDVEAIEQIAKRNNLKVIYDAAHAFGVRYKGNGVGIYGDISCFSFHATKVFNSIEGGAACFADEEIGHKLYQMKNFGIVGEDIVESVGANAKMNEFCAAMGICNLEKINVCIEKRKALTNRYREQLGAIPGIGQKKEQENVQSNYAYFPIYIDKDRYGSDRESLIKYMREKGVFPRRYFYPLASEYPCYIDKFDVNNTPIAKKISEGVVTLPLYENLSLEEVDFVCKLIEDVYINGV